MPHIFRDSHQQCVILADSRVPIRGCNEDEIIANFHANRFLSPFKLQQESL